MISRYLSFFVLLGVIVVIGVVFYRVMAAFLLPLFLAALLGVIFRPLHQWYQNRLRGRQILPAILATATVALATLGPAVVTVALAVSEGSQLAGQINADVILDRLAQLRRRLGLEIPEAEKLRQINYVLRRMGEIEYAAPDSHRSDVDYLLAATESLRTALQQEGRNVAGLTLFLASLRELKETPAEGVLFEQALLEADEIYTGFTFQLLGGPLAAWFKERANPSPQELQQWQNASLESIRQSLPSLTGAAGGWIVQGLLGIGITFVALYFIFAEGPIMLTALMRLSPLDDRYERELLVEFDRVSRAVVLAMLLAAGAQAFLAGIGFYFAGVEAVVLLTLLTGVAALIPFVGAASIWAPTGLWLIFVEDRWGAGLFLLIYGAALVSTIDNVIKPWVLHGQSRLHPLLALLSIIGGLAALGPIGIIVGPMAVAFLQTLLSILHRELASWERGQTEPHGAAGQSN